MLVHNIIGEQYFAYGWASAYLSGHSLRPGPGDEYMYLVAKDYLPEPALYMIRYHSFYPGHSANAYDALLDDHDRAMFEWVREFNRYDLYTKQDAPADVDALGDYYRDLISRYFPDTVRW